MRNNIVSMEKGKSGIKEIATSLKKLDLTNPNRNHPTLHLPSSSQLGRERKNKTPPRSLVNLCLGVLGKHLDDIVPCLGDISLAFPPHIRMAIAAIARRRKMLDDDVIVSLADSSWEVLDVSGSNVTDSGFIKVVHICKSLRAVDISQCDKITASGVSELVQHCKSLQTLRCGHEQKLMLQRMPRK